MTSVQRRYVNKTRLIKLIFELIKTRKHATLSSLLIIYYKTLRAAFFFSILAFSYLNFQSLCSLLYLMGKRMNNEMEKDVLYVRTF